MKTKPSLSSIVILAVSAGVLLGTTVTTPAAVVTTCDEPSLRAAIVQDGPVAFITFGCNGVIVLNNTLLITNNVVLENFGAPVTLSGDGRNRVLEILPGGNLVLVNLTIRDGLSTDGGAIYCHTNAGLSLIDVKLIENHARPIPSEVSPQPVRGGAIFNAGSLFATNCLFAFNSAVHHTNTPGVGAAAHGGALYNAPGADANLSTSTLETNHVIGGWGGANGVDSGPSGFDGTGGAIHNDGLLALLKTRILANQARGGAGGSVSGPLGGAAGGAGGRGMGGGVCNFGTAAITRTALDGNIVQGGAGLAGREGQPAPGFPAGQGGPGGSGGNGGSAEGAGLYNDGQTALSASSLTRNAAHGGPGGSGGLGGIGSGYGGPGGNGGAARGGGLLDATGGITSTNVTLAVNLLISGNGGSGGNGRPNLVNGSPGANGGAGGSSGAALGAGIFKAGATATHVTWTTLASNLVQAGVSGLGGAAACGRISCGMAGENGTNQPTLGGAIHVADDSASLTLYASILGPSSGAPDVSGPIVDSGYNLSSDDSASFTAVTSRARLDPVLGPLVNLGGLTLAMSPLHGSPALDQVDDANPTTVDQRGVPRPQGARSDLGAVEATFLTIEHLSSGDVRLRYGGIPGVDYTLAGSPALGTPWTAIETKPAADDGAVVYQTLPTSGPHRFFRTSSP